MKLFLLVFFLFPLYGNALSFNHAMGSDYVPRDTPLENVIKKWYKKNNYTVKPLSTQPIIPKIIHQIWIGSPLPDKYAVLAESWKKLHPDWEYRLWTDEDISEFEFTNRELFDKSENFGMKSDIWRYEILEKYGGLYVDTDFLCLKNFSCLHHTSEFYSGVGSTNTYLYMYNGLIGSIPHHPILKACIKQLGKVNPERKRSTTQIQHTTGPAFLGHLLVDYHRKNPKSRGIVIYPTTIFYPLSADGIFRTLTEKEQQTIITKSIRPHSFAIHLWEASWTKQNKLEI